MIWLKANSKIEQTYSKIIESMKEDIKWNGIFIIKNNSVILPGEINSLIFDFDLRKVYSNIIDIPDTPQDLFEIEERKLLINILNMILYMFGKWKALPLLKVGQDYMQIDALLKKILKEVNIDSYYSPSGIKFVGNGLQIVFEDVIVAAVDRIKQIEEEEKNSIEEEEEEDSQGLWHDIKWKISSAQFDKKNVTKVMAAANRIGNNFYMTSYICPECENNLHMIVYPDNKEFCIDAEDGKVYLARAYCCPECCKFYTSRPQKLLVEGDIYVLDFDDDKAAAEDYRKLIGVHAKKTSNSNFNLYEADYMNRANNKSKDLSYVRVHLNEFSDEELERIRMMMDEGFYDERAIERFLAIIEQELAYRRSLKQKLGKDLEDEDIEENNGEENVEDSENDIFENANYALEDDGSNVKEGINLSDRVKNKGIFKKKHNTSKNLNKGKTKHKIFGGSGKEKHKVSADTDGLIVNEDKSKNGIYNIKDTEKTGNDSVFSEDERLSEKGSYKADGLSIKKKNKKNVREIISDDDNEIISGSRNENINKRNSKSNSESDNGKIGAVENTDSYEDTIDSDIMTNDENFFGDVQTENNKNTTREKIEKSKEKPAATVEDFERKLAESSGKKYSDIAAILRELENSNLDDIEKEKLSTKLKKELRKKGSKELDYIVLHLPQSDSKDRYKRVKEKIKSYSDIDTEKYEDIIDKYIDNAETAELNSIVSKVKLTDRKALMDAIDNIKGLGFEKRNMQQYTDKLYDKIVEIDNETVSKICPDMYNLSVETGTKAMKEIEAADILPEIKLNMLELIDKRLTKMKSDECEQLVEKFKKNLTTNLKENRRIHFYDVRKMQGGENKDAESLIIRKALSTYAILIGKYEYPVVICDSSLSGNGKQGFIITPDHIFFKGILKSGAIDVMNIDKISLDKVKGGKGICISHSSGTNYKLPCTLNNKDQESFAEIVDEFVNYLKSKPQSRSIEYLSQEKHTVQCCYRCGHKFAVGNVCPKCGSRN